jgi:hypothetical protein
MGIAGPIIATVAAWPLAAASRIGVACLIGFSARAARNDSSVVLELSRTSSLKIAAYVVSANWAAWALAQLG